MVKPIAYRIRDGYTIQLPHRRLLRGGEILESPRPEMVQLNSWKLEPVNSESMEDWLLKQSVSIIVPAWKVANFLEDCLDSLVTQSLLRKGVEYEILLGIDGCKSTMKKALKIAKQYQNLLQVHWFAVNQGPYVIKNSLAALVVNDWLLFFDSDDTAEPNMLECLLGVGYEPEKSAIYMTGEDTETGDLKKTCGVFLISRETFMEMGGFQPWRCAADTEFLKRLSYARVKYRCIADKILMHRRVHKNQITVKSDTGFGSQLRAEYMQQIKKNQKNRLAKIELVTAASQRIA